MPIIKKDDVTPERPVIIVLYGQPGSGKTSVATTAEVPLLVDTDRGYDRSVQRVDTLVANRWEDILGAQNDMSSYKQSLLIPQRLRLMTISRLMQFRPTTSWRRTH